MAESGHVRQAGDGRWYWSSENFPASEISLRTAAPENVVIIDTSPDRPRVLARSILFGAQILVHERAIYIHESTQYYVDRLDWGEKKAYVHRWMWTTTPTRTGRSRSSRSTCSPKLRPPVAAGPRRGHGRQPRDAVQEAQVHHGRERRLGPHRSAGAGAPDHGLLADRRGHCGSLAPG